MDIKNTLVPCLAVLVAITFGSPAESEAAPNRVKKIEQAARSYKRALTRANRDFLKVYNRYEQDLTPEQIALLATKPNYSSLDDSDGDGVKDVEEDDDGFNKCDPDSDDNGIDDDEEDDDDHDDDDSSSSSGGSSSSSSDDDDSSSGSSSSSSSGSSSSGGSSSSSS
jgi:uncharacterized membrane protein YgcG